MGRNLVYLLVLSLITSPTGLEQHVHQVQVTNRSSRDQFVENIGNCSAIFVYFDHGDTKDRSKSLAWLKEVVPIMTAKDFVFVHNPGRHARHEMPRFLQKIPGMSSVIRSKLMVAEPVFSISIVAINSVSR